MNIAKTVNQEGVKHVTHLNGQKVITSDQGKGLGKDKV